ncbi:hypothetical protein JCM10213_007203 [Rhodosporidiobolus nylandii]
MSAYDSYSTYGQRLGGASQPYAAPSPPRPRQAAADAALLRAVGELSLNDGADEGTIPSWERRPWDRILNDELLAKASKPQALKTLEILLKLTENVLELPADSAGQEKQRTVSLRNALIRQNIVEVAGAFDLLVKSGFRRVVVDFEEKLTLPLLPSPADNQALLSRLRTGQRILRGALEQAQQADELERTRKEAAEAEKTRRMTEVLEGIKGDWQTVAKRVARGQAARRRAQTAKEIQEKAVREASEWDRA